MVGVRVGDASTAYDWNRLKRERVINDVIGGTPVVIVMAPDTVSFFAYERPDTAMMFALRNDSLMSPRGTYALSGRGVAGTLRSVSASQEFWHSWRTFNPGTGRY